MSIATHAELKTAVQSWLHRTDLAPFTDDFVTIAEARIAREVRSRTQQQRSTATIDDYLSLPDDFLSMRMLFVTSGGVIHKMQYLSPDALLSMYPYTATGTPKHFTIIGDQVRFGPLPSSGSTAELWYLKRLTALATAVNALFTSHPDLYLYASLCAATPFLKNDARVPLWEAQYMSVRDQLNTLEEEGSRAPDMQVVAA